MLSTEEQIIDVEDKLIQAIKAGNIAVLNVLLHNDVVFNIPSGQTISKSQDIENYRSGKMTVFEIALSDRVVQLMADVATVVVTAHLKARYGVQIIDGKFRYLRVWRLFDHSWQVIAGSACQI